MITFEEMQNELIDDLKENATDPSFWSLTEIKRAINNTYWFIADETLCFRSIFIIEVESGRRFYKLPEYYIVGSLDRIEYNEKRIYPITSDELDSYSRTWRSSSGTPTHYLPPGDLCKSDEIGLYPEPDTTGTVYNTASKSERYGVIVGTGDDSYEEFSQEEGVIVATVGDANFEGQERGPIIDLYDPTNNLRVYAAMYPKKLFNNNEVFAHPVSYNPRRIINLGSLAILFAKEGEGKDIAKASYYNKRFEETMNKILKRQKYKRTHIMRSITDISIGGYNMRGKVNLGEHYPSYPR